MATQSGILGLRGSVGGMVFAKDGSVRQKPPSNKAAFQSSSSLARTRENASEFAKAARTGKLLRNALRVEISSASDRFMVSRLTQAMRTIVGLDNSNPRGERVVRAVNAAGLLGFNFNRGASLGQALRAPFTLTASAADELTLALPNLNPTTDVLAPQGATHYRILFATVSVNFQTGTYQIGQVSAPQGIRSLREAVQTNVELVARLPVVPTRDELVVGVVGMDFYQELNGQQYPLNNNATDPLAVAYVSAQPVAGGGGGAAPTFDTVVNGPNGSTQGITLAASAGDVLRFNARTSGGSAPANMDLNVGGQQVASVTYLDRYAGQSFSFTTGGVTRTGTFQAVVNF